jgi:septal ring factor EnvC (AmiA/AmiB activator)
MRSMEHKHHWRATSKVFALVCDCGEVCHEYLSKEMDRITSNAQAVIAPVAELPPPIDVAASFEATIQQLNSDVLTLRSLLDAAQREVAELKPQLETARRELEGLRAQPAPVSFVGRPVEGSPAESGEPT